MSERALAPEEWELIRRSVARLRESVVAVAFGVVSGTGLALTTAWLLIQGGDPMGPHLGLLANYFPGYTVSWTGCLVGFAYAAATGASAKAPRARDRRSW